MADIEQDNQSLREELAAARAELREAAAMRAQMEEITAEMARMRAERNQPPPPPPPSAQMQTTVIWPTSETATSMPFLTQPEGCTVGMPGGVYVGSNSNAARIPLSIPPWSTAISQPNATSPQAIMATTAPLVASIPQFEEPIYHDGSTTNYDPMAEMREKMAEMYREMKAIRGKELFGKGAHELCLVPDVKIPLKFKIPDFEKYKGTTCPNSHLVMYVRKMSMHTSDEKLLIHFFQESLAGPAVRWYMGLDSSKIQSFNDLGEAFVRQYKYNLDMAPDRDQLRAMAQKERESFREYAQRWREVAAQINPPLEEKEMTKIFLNTLGQFYYEKMVASAPNDFTEMVNMGMRLEEGVRQGRLVREVVPAHNTKQFGNNFPKRREQEVSAVTQGKPQQRYPVYQPQFQQNPRQQQPQQQAPQQNRNQGALRFDPIPMKYAELLPALLDKNLVQTRTPPPAPARLPDGYRADLSCAFHQGAPGHDIENCYALRTAVQRLLQANMLSFKESDPNV